MSEPLTDEELNSWALLVERSKVASDGRDIREWFFKGIPRLVAEVRHLRDEWELQERTIATLGADCKHLRSDEWLQKAAEEIKSHRWTSPLDGDDKPLDVLAILRKHRDGA